MSNLVTKSATYLPAPMPMRADVERALSVALNHLEPHGLGFRIVSTDAPSDRRRREFDERRQDLRERLMPAGRLYAARRIGEMNNAMRPRDRNATQRERDAEFEKIVSGTMDLPRFAIDEAASDFEKGSYGEGFMPRLAEFRIHALGKCQLWKTELAQLEKVCAAEVVVIRSDPVRKAALLAAVRRSAQEIPEAGRAAEAERAGRSFEPAKPPETPQARLARLRSEAAKPMAPLSAAARRGFDDGAEMQGVR